MSQSLMKKESDVIWYADWRFWLLMFVINMSGNPAFGLLFPYTILIVLLFGLLFLYLFYSKFPVKQESILFVVSWIVIFFLPAFYTNGYSLSSSFHICIKVIIGVITLLILGKKFIEYYSDIIFFFCIISLLGFAYNYIVGILPYMPVVGLDDGHTFRVTSIIYTQLYNLDSLSLTYRNCGPFWEPGAFQGFVNLALALELLTADKRDKRWKIKILIFIISIITTFSTGGYIALALNILFLIFSSKSLHIERKIFLVVAFIFLALGVFFSTSFLYEKVSSDSGRLGVDFTDFFSENILYTLFGYGFSKASFEQSNIESASSVYNLIRYVGLVGFFLYFIPCIGLRLSFRRLYFVVIVFLILMNEPFITTGPFWWCIPLLSSLYIQKIA